MIEFQSENADVDTRVITAHVPATLAAKVDQLAGRRQLTLDAMADVDGGRVFDHTVVHAWAVELESETVEHGPLPRATTIEKLSRLWQEGVESGDAASIDAEDIERRGRERLAAMPNTTPEIPEIRGDSVTLHLT